MSDARETLVLKSERADIARIGTWLEQFGAAHGLVEDDVYNLQLILDELVINIIKHGHGDDPTHVIRIDLTLAGKLATLRIEDTAPPFNPTEAPPPNFDLPIEERPIGGLGVHIVKALAETMVYERIGESNVLTITKTLALQA
jgi:anti-sigma regulatory factor (Ser/Thr protein kinase)